MKAVSRHLPQPCCWPRPLPRSRKPAAMAPSRSACCCRREMGIGGILVEQNVAVALTVASRAYVLMRGSVVLEGDPMTLAASPELRDAYLGMAQADAKQETS